MRFTLLTEWGFCGFGFASDLVPELRLGIVRVAWCRGSLITRLDDLRQTLKNALAEMRRAQGG